MPNQTVNLHQVVDWKSLKYVNSETTHKQIDAWKKRKNTFNQMDPHGGLMVIYYNYVESKNKHLKQIQAMLLSHQEPPH